MIAEHVKPPKFHPNTRHEQEHDEKQKRMEVLRERVYKKSTASMKENPNENDDPWERPIEESLAFLSFLSSFPDTNHPGHLRCSR